MRSTAPRFGDMPGGKVYTSWWGAPLQKQRGITQYSLSSFQQSPTHHIFRSYLFNGYRRISGHAFYIAIPFACGYAIYTWGKSQSEYQNSKAGHIASGGAAH